MPTQKERLLSLISAMQDLCHTIDELDNHIEELRFNEPSHPKANILLLKWNAEIDFLIFKANSLKSDISQMQKVADNK